ncbi:hypothetical protein V5799_021738, partial [Amblyomma americanum]
MLAFAGQWTNLLAKYTNDMYNGGDMIQFQTQLLEGLTELLQVPYWGKEGFRAMLAWGLFDSLVDYAMPLQLVGRKDKQVACYDLILQVLEMPVTSRYLTSTAFPDMAPTGRFLDSWFKALSARAHQKWADQTHVFFNTSTASPAYIKGSNAVVIPVGALLPIFFYGDGNTALNYGSLGDALGQQIMNAFDFEAGARYCSSVEANQGYSNKKLCVRQSHEQ